VIMNWDFFERSKIRSAIAPLFSASRALSNSSMT
jgi:hypothetical protein